MARTRARGKGPLSLRIVLRILNYFRDKITYFWGGLRRKYKKSKLASIQMFCELSFWALVSGFFNTPYSMYRDFTSLIAHWIVLYVVSTAPDRYNSIIPVFTALLCKSDFIIVSPSKPIESGFRANIRFRVKDVFFTVIWTFSCCIETFCLLYNFTFTFPRQMSFIKFIMFLGQHPVQGEVWRLRQARLTYAQIISRVPAAVGPNRARGRSNVSPAIGSRSLPF